MMMHPEKDDEKLQEAVDDVDWGPERPLNDLSKFCGDGRIDLDKTDWASLDYNQGRDVEWYRKKFPGFDDDVLEILAKCDGTAPPEKDNKNQWERRQSLNAEIQKQRKTINFD
jgi:hypothetical protein